MTTLVFILLLIGIGYATELLMRFILWLDGADECEEDTLTAERKEASKERRRAA